MSGLRIQAQHLRKQFRQSANGVLITAIEQLDFVIEPGEIVAVVGSTGCGKSSLFDVMIGLQAPTAGRLLIGDREPYRDFNGFRGLIATVFQQDRLMPWRSSLDNVCLPLELIGLAPDEQHRRARGWLERLGLAAFTDAYPHELSGGMRQRVAIARAFVLQPAILLADESFGHLDEVTAAELRETFVALARECGSTAVLITHQLEEAMSVGDRVLVFAKPATVLADIRVADWPAERRGELREAIQLTLQSNRCDERIARLAVQQPADAVIEQLGARDKHEQSDQAIKANGR